jgi:hypothetical protein
VTVTTMALDRCGVDPDGHLSPIKAGISGYFGQEIPRDDEPGLEPTHLHRLMRPAAELH